MATDLSDVIKQGYMRCKSRSLGLWQKRWIILRRTSSKGPCRFEKYLNESSARNLEQHKVQLLTNVISVVRSNNRKHAFQIVFNDGSSKFYASDSGMCIVLVCARSNLADELHILLIKSFFTLR